MLDEDDCAVAVGDCRAILNAGQENFFDSCVTDPPYELGFMGKKWDASGVAFDVETWRAVLRALKPGGHLLTFSGTRTFHRMTCAIEDAGFEIRDMIDWLYGTGFPKSLNFEGRGTGLKPGHEPICVARKPLAGTVLQTFEKYGTGLLDIDGCRLGPGRWPANVCLDEDAAAELDQQSGVSKSHINPIRRDGGRVSGWGMSKTGTTHEDQGGASRFFYVAKPSRAEREEGCEALPPKTGAEAVSRAEGSAGLANPRAGAGRTAREVRNTHPTVKPVALMRWLVKLVTREGGVVLDPFVGSGTTGIAAVMEGRQFLGIELLEEHSVIAEARIRNALAKRASKA